jgi:transposase InsO family protein
MAPTIAIAHAKAEISAFIEQDYNRQRLHSALAYPSPDEYEESAPSAAALRDDS